VRMGCFMSFPDFQTLVTFSGEDSTITSDKGFADTAVTSASYPSLSNPDLGACGPSVCGPLLVAVWIACSGDIPASTKYPSSWAFIPQGTAVFSPEL